MEAMLDFMILIECGCLAVVVGVVALGRRLEARAGLVLIALCVGVALGMVTMGVWAEVHDGHVPDHPIGSHGPACVDLAWLDDRWVCVPEEEAG